MMKKWYGFVNLFTQKPAYRKWQWKVVISICVNLKKRNKFLNETNSYMYFVRLDHSSTANKTQIFVRNEISIG